MADDIYLIDPSGEHNNPSIAVGNGICTTILQKGTADQTLPDLDGRLEPCAVPCQSNS